MTAYDYLYQKVNEPLPDECLIWPYQVDRDGYGRLRIPLEIAGKRIKVAAHRLAFKFVNGYWPVPNGLHSCDNPSCFNPKHISEGDNRKNQQEKAERGRSIRGTQQWEAKLNDDLVRQIRSEYAPERGKYRKLGEKYGVCGRTIMLVVSRKLWKHVI